MENSEDQDFSAKRLNRRQLLARGAAGVSGAGIAAAVGNAVADAEEGSSNR